MLKSEIHRQIHDIAKKCTDDIRAGFAVLDKNIFNSEFLLPAYIMQQLMKGAVNHSFTGLFFELGYDPGEILQNLNLSTERKSKMLKPIKKEFYEKNEYIL